MKDMTVALHGCDFLENLAGGSGGAISMEGGESADISRSSFEDNMAGENGAAVASASSSLDISETILDGNEAEGVGGGIYAEEVDMDILNSLLSGNSGYDGGGIYLDIDSKATVSNITAANRSAYRTGGIGGESTAAAIHDCIFWKNGVDLADHYSATYSFFASLLQGEGNFTGTPGFTPGPFGDFYLDPGSVCIDAGSRTAEAAGLADRTTRANDTPDTGQVDLGYHYPLREN